MIQPRRRRQRPKPIAAHPTGLLDLRVGHRAIPGLEIAGRGLPEAAGDPMEAEPEAGRSEAARSDLGDSAEFPKETPRTSFITAERPSHRHRFRRSAVFAPGWAFCPDGRLLPRDRLADD